LIGTIASRLDYLSRLLLFYALNPAWAAVPEEAPSSAARSLGLFASPSSHDEILFYS